MICRLNGHTLILLFIIIVNFSSLQFIRLSIEFLLGHFGRCLSYKKMRLEIMKRKLLLCMLCLLVSYGTANALPLSTSPVGSGVHQKSDFDQKQQKYIEKQYIEPVEKDKGNGKTIEVGVEQDVLMQDGRVFNPQFHLNEINFDGNTVIKTKALKKMAAELEGNDVYFKDILDFTMEVTRYYHKKGYITSFALVPEQEIKNGVVTVRIVESKVSVVDISGERWAKEAYLKNILMGRKGVKEDTVFSAHALQASMKEVNEKDYMRGAATIKRTKDTNLTEIKLAVEDRFPLNLDMNWDNYGRSVTGSTRFTTILGMDNLTGYGDRAYGGVILSSGSTGALAGYEVPISPYGTKLRYEFGLSNIALGGPYQSYKIKGKSFNNFVGISHPFIKNNKAELTGSIGLDFSNTHSESSLFNVTLSDYRLRVLRSALYGMLDDSYGRWLGSIGVDAGFHFLGASGDIPNGPQSQFIKAIARLVRVQRLPLNSIGIVRVDGQYSPNRLYAIEQMQAGGPYTLRGYQPAEIIGDYGVTGTAEIRFPVPFMRAILPQKFEYLEDRFKLALFYDWGFVKEHDHIYNYPQNFLHSVGFGSYINLTKTISAQFGLGFPIGHKYYNEKSARFYFGISTEFDKFMEPKSHPTKEKKQKQKEEVTL